MSNKNEVQKAPAFNAANFKQTSADGVWADWQNAQWLSAKSGTTEHIAIQERVFKPYKNQLESNVEMDKSLRKELMAEVIAKALLKGWSDNVIGFDGEDLEYSWQAAKDLILGIPELGVFVTTFAMKHSNYRAMAVAETAKKSQTTSTGESPEEKKKESSKPS